MTQSRRYGLAVFIGRFSPPHLGHRAVIEQALRVAESTLIVIGSANAARRFDFVPFTAPERERMIRLMFSAEENRRIKFAYVEDQGNVPAWAALVRKAANAVEPDNKRITLIGHSKDNSSFYLKHFRGWDAQDVDNYMGLSATTFRDEMFAPYARENDDGTVTFVRRDFDPVSFTIACRDGLHPEVIDWLIDFTNTSPWGYLCEEAAKCAQDVETYGRIDPATGKKVYGPYLAADFILIQGDHVLMIERGGYPFKGCVAFPGGFVDHDEDVVEAALREAVEETKIKVPEHVLRRAIVRTEPFSSPFRDPRGRVVTFATLMYLNPIPPSGLGPREIEKFLELPRVKGADDAKRAFWMPLSEVRRETTAFDHYSILQRMLEFLPRED